MEEERSNLDFAVDKVHLPIELLCRARAIVSKIQTPHSAVVSAPKSTYLIS